MSENTSRVENIIRSSINGEVYNSPLGSRIEAALLELINKTGGGESGGSVNIEILLQAENWSSGSAPYTQTVSISGITAQLRPILDICVSGTASEGIEQIKQWNYISKAETGTGTITFYCYNNKPTVDLTVMVKVV